MIYNENNIIKYLIKNHNKKPKSKKEMAIEFVREFNKEAKKQNSQWFAEFEEHISSFDGEKFTLLYIKKRVARGWWIFKEIITTSLHVGCYEHHYSFVGNDYACSEYGNKENEKIFIILSQIRTILKNIPLAFVILEDYSEGAMIKQITKIKQEIQNLQQKCKE